MDAGNDCRYVGAYMAADAAVASRTGVGASGAGGAEFVSAGCGPGSAAFAAGSELIGAGVGAASGGNPYAASGGGGEAQAGKG